MLLERRREFREEVEDCRVQIIAKKYSCWGKVVNISDGGINVEADTVPPKLEELRICVKTGDGRVLYKSGIVVWFVAREPPDYGCNVGIKFLKDIDKDEFDKK